MEANYLKWPHLMVELALEKDKISREPLYSEMDKKVDKKNVVDWIKLKIKHSSSLLGAIVRIKTLSSEIKGKVF